MTTEQLPDRVHPTGSETKNHVFNNQITDNVDIYHSEATTLIPKACTMKYTQNIRAHTVTTHIQPQNPEIIYEFYHTAHTNHTASNAINIFLWLHKVIQGSHEAYTKSVYYEVYTKHKGTYRNYSYTTSKPRDYIRTFTILLIPTIQLQMR